MTHLCLHVCIKQPPDSIWYQNEPKATWVMIDALSRIISNRRLEISDRPNFGPVGKQL